MQNKRCIVESRGGVFKKTMLKNDFFKYLKFRNNTIKVPVIIQLLPQLRIKAANHLKLFHRPLIISLSLRRNPRNGPYLSRKY